MLFLDFEKQLVVGKHEASVEPHLQCACSRRHTTEPFSLDFVACRFVLAKPGNAMNTQPVTVGALNLCRFELASVRSEC